MAQSSRRPDIQGLRAIAVLMVIAFHAGLPLPGGFVGVDVFFVISGYVITAMLQREWLLSGRIAFRHFYLRRFKRLTPALALTVVATVLVSAFVLSPLGPQQTTMLTAMGAMLLAANWAIVDTTGDYFDAPAATNPLLNLWSLSVEEQFYLVFPLLLVLGWRLGRRWVMPLVLLVSVASFVGAVLGTQGVGGDWLGFYSPFSRAWEFGVGSLVALSGYRFRDVRATGVAYVGLALVFASLWTITERTPFPSAWTLLPVVGTALLIMAGESSHSISRLLSHPLMVRIGDWSYSLYLWHWPVIVIAGIAFPNYRSIALIAAVVSVIPALVSYHYVEEPFRNRHVDGQRLPWVALSVVGVPVVVAAATLFVANDVRLPQFERTVADSQAMHAGYEFKCHFGPGWGNIDPRPCVWNGDATGKPVYLLGDSNAAQWVEALIGATERENRSLQVATSSGCPYLDLFLQQANYPGYDERCWQRNLRLRQWIMSEPRGTVVIASSEEYWVSSTTGIGRNGRWEVDVPTKVSLYRTSLQRVVSELKAAGHEVLLVQGVPHFVDDYAWDISKCSMQALQSGCTKTMPLAWSQERTKTVDQALQQVARATGARSIDLSTVICPDGVCRTSDNGFPVYRDGTHLTVAMSERLAPRFVAVL